MKDELRTELHRLLDKIIDENLHLGTYEVLIPKEWNNYDRYNVKLYLNWEKSTKYIK